MIRGKTELTLDKLLTLDELYEEFEFLGEWEDQCRYLIELGEQLPDLADSEKSESNRVLGCQARVWLVNDMQPNSDIVQFHAKSDARLVDGLIVILSMLFNGKSASEVLATDARAVFKRLSLESQLVPQRRNGLYAMVERVRSLAKQSDNVVASTRVTDKKVDSPSETPSRPFDLTAVRQQFPILAQVNPAGRRVVYLDSASSSQKPRVVIDKEREVYEQYYANAYRGVYRFGDRISRELELVRGQIARLIGAASSEEIVFTSGATMSLNLIAQGWGGKFLRPGDEVLLPLYEHHANIVPWQWIAKRTGAIVRFAPLLNDTTLDLEAFDRLITPRTKVISVTGLSNVTGVITPLAHVGRMARERGAILVVDGAQSVPHLPIDVVKEQIDFLAFSGHKLYGPSGVGVCYGRRELLEAMDPFLCGGHMIAEVNQDGFKVAPIPAKFEAGTLPIAQAIALGPAIEFVESAGLDAIHRHELELLDYAKEQLVDVPGLKTFGPMSGQRGGILSFTIENASAQDIASVLDVHAICVRHGHHCTMPLHQWLNVPATVRASFGVYNTREDVDALVDGLHATRKLLKLN